jgi:hypothetical protein
MIFMMMLIFLSLFYIYVYIYIDIHLYLYICFKKPYPHDDADLTVSTFLMNGLENMMCGNFHIYRYMPMYTYIYITLYMYIYIHIFFRDGGKNMMCKFPGDNVLQEGLAGQKIKTGGGILIKLRIKKIKNTGSGNEDTDLNTLLEEAVKIEVLGRVDSSYVFNQLSDYQFLPESTGLIDINIQNNGYGQNAVLETIPRPCLREKN